jgi:hypothetical protein
MSRNPKKKKTRNKLETGLNEWEFGWKYTIADTHISSFNFDVENEWEFGWKRRKAYTIADTHISSFNFDVETVRLSG